MKRVLAVFVAVMILALTALPVFATPSPSKPNEYDVVVHNTNGGTATYTTVIDNDGKHITVVAHPKNGFEFSKWKITGNYRLEYGDLDDGTITIIALGDVEITPVYSDGNGSTISIDSDTKSPKTGESSLYVVLLVAAAFLAVSGAVGVKLAVSKK